SSNVPVDLPNVVSIGIFTNFGKLHPAALESGLVFSAKDIIYDAFSANLNLSYLSEYLFGNHGACVDLAVCRKNTGIIGQLKVPPEICLPHAKSRTFQVVNAGCSRIIMEILAI